MVKNKAIKILLSVTYTLMTVFTAYLALVVLALANSFSQDESLPIGPLGIMLYILFLAAIITPIITSILYFFVKETSLTQKVFKITTIISFFAYLLAAVWFLAGEGLMLTIFWLALPVAVHVGFFMTATKQKLEKTEVSEPIEAAEPTTEQEV